MLLFSLLTFLVAACTDTSEDVQSASPADIETALMAVTPETLVTELEPAETLSAAADQLAAMLGVNKGNILIRIQSRDCAVCKIDASAVEYPDMPVDDAESFLETNDKFWLVVQDLTCYYYYDGKTVSPLACGPDGTAK